MGERVALVWDERLAAYDFGPGHPLAQSRDEALNAQFGSAHAGLCGFLMADGSAQFMTTDVNPDILGQLARR